MKENISELQILPVTQSNQIFKQSDKEWILIQYELSGKVDINQLQLAWDKVIKFTPILRSVYKEIQNKYFQIILKELPNEIIYYDLHQCHSEEKHQKIEEMNEQTVLVMDIDKHAPMKLILYYLDKEEYVLQLQVNSKLLDEQSIQIILEDLFKFYRENDGYDSQKDHTRSSYKEYQKFVSEQDWTNGRQFWDRKTESIVNTSFSIERFSKNKVSYRNRNKSRPISGKLSQKFSNLTKDEISVILQSAWGILLHLYSGETTVGFHAATSCRPNSIPDSEGNIGLFSQHVPVEMTIYGEESIVEVLDRMRGQLQKINRYSFIPVNEGQPIHHESITSLVTMSEFKPIVFDDGKINVHLKDIIRTWQPPLVLEFKREQNEVQLHFSPLLYDEKMMENMLAHFVTIIKKLIEQPNDFIKDIYILSSEEERLLFSFNSCSSDSVPKKFAHQIIEEMAVTIPNKIAIVEKSRNISYKELNEKANQLAHWFREHGIGRDDLVGIFSSRNIEMVISILATLKAGAAYVPFDPDSPDTRIQTMIKDCNLKIMMATNSLLERTVSLIKNTKTDTIFCMKGLTPDDTITDWGKLQNYSVQDPTCINKPQDLANIFFTSGSTGKPKGAMVEHRGMLNHLWAKIDLLELNEDSVVSQNASHCFDISVWQFLAPLMVGGRLHIYENNISNNPSSLFKSIKEDRITDLELVPTMMEMMISTIKDYSPLDKSLPELKNLISTGEALSADLTKEWLSTYEGLRIINAYGATECSDDTNHEVIQNQHEISNTVPIGKVIPNMNAYLLNRYLKPVPIGCVGEICFSGIGVGRGYINNPVQTRKAFIDSPFYSQDRYKTLYRTGDLGRFLPDGRIEYLGRLDHQIKIRGHRIELGEIEAVLINHEDVQKNLIVNHPTSNGENSICAYIVAAKALQKDDLTNYLKGQLPDYMVPEHFIFIEDFPLNENGKIDRKRLPSPKDVKINRVIMEPRNDFERTLTQIWSDILGVSQVSIDDDFFNLGGNSLRVVQVRTRINETLKLKVELDSLFRISKLKDLAVHLSELKEESTEPIKISPAPKSNYYSLSNAQKRIWFLHQMNPKDTSYNTYGSYELKGDVNISLIVKVFNHLVERHSSLRTVFKMVDGKPVQQIKDNLTIDIPIVNHMHLDEKKQEIALLKLVEEAASKPFDLEKGPLIDGMVVKREKDSFILLVRMHHIITDGWSWKIWEKEFLECYNAYKYNRSSLSKPLQIQYVDFAHWQSTSLENGDFSSDEDYWLEKLSGELPILELPTDYPRPPIQTFDGKTKSIEVNKETFQQLKNICNETDSTLYMSSIAILSVLLARISGQKDFIIGSPVAGRPEMELENLIGLFINTLPIRLQIQGNPKFKDFLKQVKQDLLEAYNHQNYPFDVLVEKINPDRDLSRTPIFSVLSQLNHYEEKNEARDFSFKSISFERNTTNFDLVINFLDLQDNLKIDIQYNVNLFKEYTIERMLTSIQALIEEIVENPDKPIYHIGLIDRDQYQLLDEWNNTTRELDRNVLTHQLFERQVRKIPNKTAVICDGQTYSYKQLNQRANGIAQLLRGYDVKGENVGICTERSIYMVEAILGIMKAGGTFIPIDPTLPEERKQYIMRDANMKLIVTDSNEIISNGGSPITILNIQNSQLPSDPFVNSKMVRYSDPAYVIYTSGSTGNPKGVKVSHLSLVNFLLSMNEKPGMNENDTLLAVTTFSFDISILEILLPLIVGARIQIATTEQTRNGELLAECVEESKANIMQATPATWRLLLKVGWNGSDYLEKILCGGEALSEDLAEQLITRCGTLWNMYGPTEATIWATIKRIDNSTNVNIGSPINNYKIYVLDEHLQRVPIGVKGELYISGLGVAEGYLNKEQLTENTFIHNPYEEETSHLRLYKTGDIVRLNSDGELEYFGRKDFQVKLRGYRIELEEIQKVLLGIPEVLEAVVLVTNKKDGNELEAYVVKGNEISEEKIRQTLMDKLPVYMVPARFIEMDSIPVNSNGKVDRKKLSTYSQKMSKNTFYKSPRSLIEFKLIEIWEDILGIKPIGVDDNFFLIGGHSLKAVELINRIYNTFGIKLPLTLLFKSPTVTDLAVHINKGEELESNSLVQLQKGTKDLAPLYLVHPQGGGVLSYYHLSRAIGSDYTVYGLRAIGHETNDRPLNTIDEMVDRYLLEIIENNKTGPYYLAGWSMGGVIAYELANRLEQLGKKVGLLGLIDTHSVSKLIGEEKEDRGFSSPLIQYAALMGIEEDYNPSLSETEGLKILLSHSIKTGYLPKDANISDMKQRVDLMISGYHALTEYQPTQKIKSDINLFRATKTDRLPIVEAEEWIDHTDGKVQVHDIDGTHDTIIGTPHVYTIADSLRELLKKDQSRLSNMEVIR